MSTNVVWSKSSVLPKDREAVLDQCGCVVWLTGLPGSGKSTIATLLERDLIASGHASFLLDGDNLRHGLCRDLTFSAIDRHENIRRVSEVAKLFADAGIITITAFISPYELDRNFAKETIGANRFIETFIDAPLAECEKRDPKGHWKKARAGDIKDFTGIDAPFEIPSNPQIHLDTFRFTPPKCVSKILEYLSVYIKRKDEDDKSITVKA